MSHELNLMFALLAHLASLRMVPISLFSPIKLPGLPCVHGM